MVTYNKKKLLHLMFEDNESAGHSPIQIFKIRKVE